MMAKSVFEMCALGLRPKPKQMSLKDIAITKKKKSGDLVELSVPGMFNMS